MHDRTGAWRQLMVETPAGDMAKMYTTSDRSRANVKCQQLLKRMLKGWREKHAGLQISMNLADMELRQDWQQFARVEWDDKANRARAIWNEACLHNKKVDAPMRTLSLGPRRQHSNKGTKKEDSPAAQVDPWADYTRRSSAASSRGRSPAASTGKGASRR